MGNGVIKRFGGYPCCHRQWKDSGHCRYLHGYDRWIEITWRGPRDHRGWVVDFGGLKDLKQAFEFQFDHTCLVAEDDPKLDTFRALQGALDLRIMDPTMEGMAIWVAEMAIAWTEENAPAAEVVRVECWENEKNAAIWTLHA